MTDKHLDCRGLACPSPVLRTKELVDQGDVARLTVLVDNPAARENVGRFLTRAGYEVQVKAEAGGAYAVTGSRTALKLDKAEVALPEPASAQKILILIGTDRMGTGDDGLGQKLIANFIGTLKELADPMHRQEMVRRETGRGIITNLPYDGELVWGVTARITVLSSRFGVGRAPVNRTRIFA